MFIWRFITNNPFAPITASCTGFIFIGRLIRTIRSRIFSTSFLSLSLLSSLTCLLIILSRSSSFFFVTLCLIFFPSLCNRFRFRFSSIYFVFVIFHSYPLTGRLFHPSLFFGCSSSVTFDRWTFFCSLSLFSFFFFFFFLVCSNDLPGLIAQLLVIVVVLVIDMHLQAAPCTGCSFHNMLFHLHSSWFDFRDINYDCSFRSFCCSECFLLPPVLFKCKLQTFSYFSLATATLLLFVYRPPKITCVLSRPHFDSVSSFFFFFFFDFLQPSFAMSLTLILLRYRQKPPQLPTSFAFLLLLASTYTTTSDPFSENEDETKQQLSIILHNFILCRFILSALVSTKMKTVSKLEDTFNCCSRTQQTRQRSDLRSPNTLPVHHHHLPVVSLLPRLYFFPFFFCCCFLLVFCCRRSSPPSFENQ